MVFAEMVPALSWTTLLWPYLLFLIRLAGWETEKPETWNEVILTAIPKKTDKVGLQSMRYISLLPVLQKFYIRALQTAVKRERRPNETNILGYEPGRSTAGITATLRQILGKAAEWGIGAFVASADVEGAFDCIRHMDIERALLQKKEFILAPFVPCSENPVISRVELTCLELQCHLLFHMIVVLGKGLSKDQTCGIKYWTMLSENRLLDGKLRELASNWQPNIEGKRTGELFLEKTRKAPMARCYIISVVQMTCTRWRVPLSI